MSDKSKNNDSCNKPLRNHKDTVFRMLFKEITMEEFTEIRAREAYGDGVQKGLEAGIQKGKREGQYEIARKLKARGTEASDIAEITGLEIEEIEKL